MYSFYLFGVCLIALVLITPVYNAPKHKYRDNSSTKYDQKQTGDYNVQLHLKDFHIFALLGDDSWGNFGEYDYNYDYSELTIKPSSPSTSENPAEASSLSETNSVEITTPKIPSSTNPETTSQSLTQSSATSAKPETPEPEKLSSTETTQQPLLSSTVKIEKTTKSENIPVTSISLIPVKIIQDLQNDHPIPLGEILHYRKCSDGYSKDAQGRCRKITRKNFQLPFRFTRIASNFASKIRQAASVKESLR